MGAALDHVTVWSAFAHPHASGNWHPLAILSHKLDQLLWGRRAAGHHLSSILLHACNAALVVLLGRAVCMRRLAATSSPVVWAAVAMSALAWAVHPLRVESAVWISERKDVLCASFYLLGLLAYLRHVAGQQGRPTSASADYWIVLACQAAALASKPMAVSFPVVLLILDYFPLARRGPAWRLVVEKLPSFAMSGLAAVLALHAQRASGAYRALSDLSPGMRVMVAVRAGAAYLGKTLWPSPLLPSYSYPRGIPITSPQFLVPAALLLFLLGATLVLARRRPAVLAAFASYVALLLPVLGLVQVGPQAMADRYTYLPSIPLFLLASPVLVKLLAHAQTDPRQGLLAAPLLLPLLLWARLTVAQTAVWHDSESLWTHELRYEPSNMEAHNSRATYYFDHGFFAQALADYDAALASPAQVSASHAQKRRAGCLNDRAITYIQLGQWTRALSDFNQAIALMPDESSYYVNRAELLERMARYEAAHDDRERARQLTSGRAPAQPR